MARLAIELLALLYFMHAAYKAGRETGRAEGSAAKPTPQPPQDYVAGDEWID